MGRSRFVKPETVRVTVFGDEWLELKKVLSVGEQREIGKLLMEVRDGLLVPNLEFTGGLGDVYAYLVDWSLSDDGKSVEIDTNAKKLAAIRALDPDAFKEIEAAVDAHVARMEAERDEEKNAQATSSASEATSTSVA